MARPLRLEFPGALYHITSRGDAREDIYRGDGDRRMFLALLAEVCERFNWWGHAYCLMSNHYHLLMETPDANLSRGMRQLNGVYTRRFNDFHGRCGHVFQGRYKAIIVQKETYLRELARYIVLNPVRARILDRPQDWPWSSYSATTGEASCPSWLRRDWLLSAFGLTEAAAVAHYRRFVAEGIGQPGPWEQLKQQVFLGSDAFVEEVSRRVPKDRDLSEVPLAQRRPPAKPLAEYVSLYPDRDQAIAAAYASGGYTLKEIGNHFGLHYARISRIVRAAGVPGR
ncbi:transposase [Thioflavicoccus mobilis 8321]|uniref:Transposase n=1 Tax=Thioflavicoccus mobilis 8321 TaxID=765912 RepID=L0GUG7_9GAMM|nr:transposase [Thioflavicoccus mobilis]AGA89641.1 transposase [Thioflavicoccus mobilis 8321]